MKHDPDEEYEKDLREQCKFDEYIATKDIDEDEEEVDDDKEGD
jgi:hypothetical protein